VAGLPGKYSTTKGVFARFDEQGGAVVKLSRRKLFSKDVYGLPLFLIAVLTLLLPLIVVSVSVAAQILIAWDPSSDANVVGYKVYYGTSSGNYGPAQDVGNVTNCTLKGLAANQTYYLSVTAYDGSRGESGFSNEVSGRASENGQIIWRNTATGQNVAWYMKGIKWTGGWTYLSTVSDPNWSIVGVADFTGEGKQDLLWRNASTGRTTIWHMNDEWIGGYTDLSPAVSDPSWTIVGVADFNGDGKSDLLWRNSSTGQVTVWYMNGVTWTGGYEDLFPGVSDLSWGIVGVADFNGDGKPDILWRNNTTGQKLVWYLNGVSRIGSAVEVLPAVGDPNWKIVSVRDFNGDGKPDLLWRNGSTGQTVVWYMNGTTWTGDHADLLPTISDPRWTIVGH
jgi:hypothetical protein